MSFIDMLALSVSNLFKRKIRTVLTVLGVVIGVASIVVMVSLGLGLNKSVMESMQDFAQLTAVTVNQGDVSSSNEKDRKYLTDDLIEEISQLDHVLYVAPIIQLDCIAKYGSYTAWMTLTGTSLQYLNDMNIAIEEGRLPSEADKDLQLFYGNMIIINFNTRNGKSYWESGELPDVDLMHDSIMYILDSEKYYAFQNSSTDENGTPIRSPKKYLLSVAGVAAGGPDEWHPYSFSTYCDIDKLVPLLKKEFKNQVIPNQPTRKNGKAYKEIFYNQ
ncbi:MAG: ABC transporter permease, partial [Lachnospiraceae bacterium]|nr:ABC transporter permease [Lachnospiraceae bacterium]